MSTQARNLVFGVQDGVVTTIGLMAGVSIGRLPRQYVIRFVGISVLVSAVSMAIGSYQSERAAQNFSGPPDRVNMGVGAAVMFMAYLVAGSVVMTPYFFSRNTRVVIFSAIAISVVILFIAGWYSAKNARDAGGTETSLLSNAIETAALGFAAILVGSLSGHVSQILDQGKYSKVK